MSEININIYKAVVTAIKEFNTCKGYGVDFYVEAKCSDCTVYLQIVFYDRAAQLYYKSVHEGDYVIVSGTLKVKPYIKKDGTTGCSLLIEKPTDFCLMTVNKSEKQEQYNNSCNTTSQTETLYQSADSSYEDEIPEAEPEDERYYF